MSQDLEKMLRTALDEVDDYRKRVRIGTAVLGLIVFGLLFRIESLSRTSDLKAILPFVVATIVVSQVTTAVITWGIIAESARRTLKAIELLSSGDQA